MKPIPEIRADRTSVRAWAIAVLSLTLVLIPGQGAQASSIHRIVFSRNVGGQAEIGVVNPDGSHSMRLTFRHPWDEFPEWSPDGARIAFDEAPGAAPSGIFVMSADGSGITRLTSNPSGYDQGPTWSPDGSKIAFASVRSDQSDIYVMNADGSSLTQLTNDKAIDADPEWSSDGTRIVYVRARRDNPDIFVIDADGSGRVRLTKNHADDINPAWSPDGSAIAFASNRHGSYDLFLIGSDGTGLRRITDTSRIYEREPAWSPSGRRIAFDRYRFIGAVLADIFVIRLRNGHVYRLTDTRRANFSLNWK